MRGHLLRDQPVAGGMEVVEDLLLVLAHPRVVPVLSFLGAAPDAGVGEETARLSDRDGDR